MDKLKFNLKTARNYTVNSKKQQEQRGMKGQEMTRKIYLQKKQSQHTSTPIQQSIKQSQGDDAPNHSTLYTVSPPRFCSRLKLCYRCTRKTTPSSNVALSVIIWLLQRPSTLTQVTHEDDQTGREKYLKTNDHSQNQTHFSEQVSLSRSFPTTATACFTFTLLRSLSLPLSLPPTCWLTLERREDQLGKQSPINKLLTAGQYMADCRGERKGGTATRGVGEQGAKIPGRQ